MTHFVTEITRGTGSGHFKRMIALAKALGHAPAACRFFVRTDLEEYDFSVCPFEMVRSRRWSGLAPFLSGVKPDEPVIVDVRFLRPGILRLLRRVAKPVFYDVSAPKKGLRGLLINPFPYPGFTSADPGLLHHAGREFILLDPEHLKPGPGPRRIRGARPRALVSFGGTDPYRLTLQLMPMISRLGTVDFTVIVPVNRVISDRITARRPAPNITLKSLGPDLVSEIRSCDILVSAFSTTLYEALRAGKTAVCVNPTGYHQGLMRYVGDLGIPSIHRRNLTFAWFEDAVRQSLLPNAARMEFGASIDSGGRSIRKLLARYVRQASRVAVVACPVCGSSRQSLLLNRLDKRLFRCRRCGTNHLHADRGNPMDSYTARYFNAEYRSQYGRTYVEDRPVIENLAGERLKVIGSLLGPERSGPGRRLLDLGCAYGFFLDAARKRGMQVRGVEFIPEAARYGKTKLKLDVRQGDVEKADLGCGWDAVTLWYVLEHLASAVALAPRLAAAVNRGGVLALGIPNGAGFSFRFNRAEWLRQRPDDHFLDLTVRSASLLFGRHGLKLVRVVNRGIHFSRLKSALGCFRNLPETPFFHQLFSVFSRFFNLGDTLELYFRKK
jgi:spore coat polysaccharide biosynthesis predicted glycosyltransferase SpsG/SAM-dependent methyltransferase